MLPAASRYCRTLRRVSSRHEAPLKRAQNVRRGGLMLAAQASGRCAVGWHQPRLGRATSGDRDDAGGICRCTCGSPGGLPERCFLPHGLREAHVGRPPLSRQARAARTPRGRGHPVGAWHMPQPSTRSQGLASFRTAQTTVCDLIDCLLWDSDGNSRLLGLQD
jgi:hypothetical protein